MATKVTKPKTSSYGQIQRGCSLTIPVVIKDTSDIPLDLTGMTIAFTAKKLIENFDQKDQRAYIQKTFAPQEPTLGRFFIILSSKDTDFEPGTFYFDVEVTDITTGMVYRICTLDFILSGGPTNRTINAGIGQLPVGDEISITSLDMGAPIVVIAPMVAFNATTYADITAINETLAEQELQITTLQEQVVDLQLQINAFVPVTYSE